MFCESVDYRLKRPSKLDAVHMELDRLELTPKGVAEFARKFGPLGWRRFFSPSLPEGQWAENYWDWLVQVERLRSLIVLGALRNRPERERRAARSPNARLREVLADAPSDVKRYLGFAPGLYSFIDSANADALAGGAGACPKLR